MNYCPCCSDILLRHIQGNTIHWFCRTCWQKMPVFNEDRQYLSYQISSLESQRRIKSKEKPLQVNQQLLSR
ncbi:MAG: hypothetical protein IGS39_00665 [Calothrix sp. C42_A2020_038]|nr:hypothetical protein [Calothrix sp. C42_A2020_038]